MHSYTKKVQQVGCYFGANRALNHPNGISNSEKEIPVKEGGTGVNNIVIKSGSKCEILRLSIANLRDVLRMVTKQKHAMFQERLVDKIAEKVENLEKLNTLIIESTPFETSIPRREDWMLPPSQRPYYVAVPELQRQEIQAAFEDIQILWRHLSRGANTAPKMTVDVIKQFLGEGGSECYDKVFAPMEEQTAPNFLDVETVRKPPSPPLLLVTY
jgi:hypothetical protein